MEAQKLQQAGKIEAQKLQLAERQMMLDERRQDMDERKVTEAAGLSQDTHELAIEKYDTDVVKDNRDYELMLAQSDGVVSKDGKPTSAATELVSLLAEVSQQMVDVAAQNAAPKTVQVIRDKNGMVAGGTIVHKTLQ